MCVWYMCVCPYVLAYVHVCVCVQISAKCFIFFIRLRFWHSVWNSALQLDYFLENPMICLSVPTPVTHPWILPRIYRYAGQLVLHTLNYHPKPLDNSFVDGLLIWQFSWNKRNFLRACLVRLPIVRYFHQESLLEKTFSAKMSRILKIHICKRIMNMDIT